MYYFLTIFIKLLCVAASAFIFTNAINVISESKFINERRRKKYDFLTKEDIDILKQGINSEKKNINNTNNESTPYSLGTACVLARNRVFNQRACNRAIHKQFRRVLAMQDNSIAIGKVETGAHIKPLKIIVKDSQGQIIVVSTSTSIYKGKLYRLNLKRTKLNIEKEVAITNDSIEIKNTKNSSCD